MGLNSTGFSQFFVNLVENDMFPIKTQSGGLTISERLTQDWFRKVTKMVSGRHFDRCLHYGDFLSSLEYTCTEKYRLEVVSRAEDMRLDTDTRTVYALPDRISEVTGEVCVWDSCLPSSSQQRFQSTLNSLLFPLSSTSPVFTQMAFDILLFPSLMQRILRTNNAIKEFHKITAPGGFIFWSAPFIAPQAPDAGDFVKFTFQGATHLTSKGPYSVLNVVGLGDRNMVLAELAGLRDDQVPPSWFDLSKPSRAFIYPLTICVVGRKIASGADAGKATRGTAKGGPG